MELFTEAKLFYVLVHFCIKQHCNAVHLYFGVFIKISKKSCGGRTRKFILQFRNKQPMFFDCSWYTMHGGKQIVIRYTSTSKTDYWNSPQRMPTWKEIAASAGRYSKPRPANGLWCVEINTVVWSTNRTCNWSKQE